MSAAKPNDLVLVEGVSGTWFYHLAEAGAPRPALCGERGVMPTAAPLSLWGYRGHLRERYCAECAAVAKQRGVVLPRSDRRPLAVVSRKS